MNNKPLECTVAYGRYSRGDHNYFPTGKNEQRKLLEKKIFSLNFCETRLKWKKIEFIYRIFCLKVIEVSNTEFAKINN